jgi:hypothetical protein
MLGPPVGIEDEGTLIAGVSVELERHEAEAEREAKEHEKKKHRHARLVYALGIPAGTLAVAAGSTALAEAPTWVTALIAFASATASAAMTVVQPGAGRVDHGRKQADFLDFARCVRLTRLRITGQPSREQFDALEALNKTRYTLDGRNPVRQEKPEDHGGT